MFKNALPYRDDLASEMFRNSLSCFLSQSTLLGVLAYWMMGRMNDQRRWPITMEIAPLRRCLPFLPLLDENSSRRNELANAVSSFSSLASESLQVLFLETSVSLLSSRWLLPMSKKKEEEAENDVEVKSKSGWRAFFSKEANCSSMAATARWMCLLSLSFDSLVRFLFRLLSLGIITSVVISDFEILSSRRRWCSLFLSVAATGNRRLFWLVAMASRARLVPPITVICVVVIGAVSFLSLNIDAFVAFKMRDSIRFDFVVCLKQWCVRCHLFSNKWSPCLLEGYMMWSFCSLFFHNLRWVTYTFKSTGLGCAI